MEGISVEQAVEQILQHTPVINETEETELNKAGGRVLAQDMVAGFDNPPFDKSPVDGYACKAEDLAGRFVKNFEKYATNAEGKALIAAGPKA